MSWEDRAGCRGIPRSRFFEEAYEESGTGAPAQMLPGLEYARSVCAGCPVRVDCFAAAMAEESAPGFFIDEPRVSVRHGVRGGLTPQQRYSLYLRDSWRCERCDEIYDPLGLVAGEAVCDCGSFSEPPVHDRGDQWGQREDGLLRRITAWVLENTQPGDLLPTLTELKKLIGDNRKDAAARWVVEKLCDDGLLEASGAGNQIRYRRLEGRRAWATYVPPSKRKRAA